jgi:prepilin-type N-terminal cleavage/methylation domain-containing protein
MSVSLLPVHPWRGRGFTLIEVMISIFLTLILIVGINQAFKIMSSTVGAGQAMAVSTRDSFSAQLVLQQELSQALSHSAETPYLIIDSQAQKAFLHRQDAAADRDNNPLTIDLDNNNTEGEAGIPGENATWLQPGDRVHRIDTLGFFATGKYRRQTGNDANAWPKAFTLGVGVNDPYEPASASFAAKQIGQQAFVWFGHVWQPTTTATVSPNVDPATGWYVDNATPQTPSYPGEGTAGTNPNNFYATDWTVGRMQILLTPGYKRPEMALDIPMTWDEWHKEEPTEMGGTRQLGKTDKRPAPTPLDQPDPGGATHGRLLAAIDRPPFIAPPTPLNGKLPTSADKETNYLPLAQYFTLKRAPSGQVATYPWSAGTPADWCAASWDTRPEFQHVSAARYDCAVGDFSTLRSILAQSIARGNYFNVQSKPYNWRWWESLSYRFRANPNVTKPMDPMSVAQSQPIFLRHCTQFIVEYAGDFLKQSNETYIISGTTYKVNSDCGNVMDVYFDRQDPQPTDGLIDYYIMKGVANDPKTWVRKIRWYGFPRDMNGDRKVQGYFETTPGSTTQPPKGGITNNQIVDVVPLRDIMLTGYTETADPINGNMRPWAGHGWAANSGYGSLPSVPPSPLPTFAGAPFEKDLEAMDNNDGLHMGYLPSAGIAGGFGTANGDYATKLGAGARYLCAFGPVGAEQNNFGGGRRVYTPNVTKSASNPQLPLVADTALARIRLIRVTITLDDPNNRLPEGQTFEYVFALP